jgi:antirestriction protein
MRVYIASLSDYNDGRLEGKWFDLSDYMDASDLMDDIQEMLNDLTKKYKNVDGEVREEWAVHDYEGIPPTLASEYMGEADFEKLIEIRRVAEDRDIPVEVLVERAGDTGSDDYEALAESLVMVVDGSDETDIVYELENQMGDLGNDFWKDYIFIDDVTERVMYGEDVDRFREDILYDNPDMDEDEAERQAEEMADEEAERRKDLSTYLEDLGYGDEIPNFVTKDYNDAWKYAISYDYDVINYDDQMYVFTNNYSVGGTILSGLVGAYIGYKIGRSKPQKKGFETEKKIGRKIKGAFSKKKYAEGGGVRSFRKGGRMFGEDARLEYVDDAFASEDLKDELREKLGIEGNSLGDNVVISFAYTDYGGDFLDKVAIRYFEENYPENTLVENAGYGGQNAYVFGEPAQEWIESTDDYPLGMSGLEDLYYEMQNESEDESFSMFLDDLERDDYVFDRDEVMEWLIDNRGGYYTMTTQGLDISYSDLTNSLLNEGLISQEDEDEYKYAKGGGVPYKSAIEEFNNKLISHSSVIKLANHYDKTPQEIVRELQPRISTKGNRNKLTTEVYIDYTDTNSGISVKHKEKFAEGGEISKKYFQAQEDGIIGIVSGSDAYTIEISKGDKFVTEGVQDDNNWWFVKKVDKTPIKMSQGKFFDYNKSRSMVNVDWNKLLLTFPKWENNIYAKMKQVRNK